MGIESFQAKYKIDLFAIAAEFARTTTDKALRQALLEQPDIYSGRLASAAHAR